MQERESLLLWLVWEGKFPGINTRTHWELTVEPQYHRETPSHILSTDKYLGHYAYSQTRYKTETCLLCQVGENSNLTPSEATGVPRDWVTAIKWQSHRPFLVLCATGLHGTVARSSCQRTNSCLINHIFGKCEKKDWALLFISADDTLYR